MRDVAAAAAACLTETGHAGNTYRLSGPDILTSHELAETLADVLGRPVVAQTPPTELAIQGMRNAGLPEWAIDHFPSLPAPTTAPACSPKSPAPFETSPARSQQPGVNSSHDALA